MIHIKLKWSTRGISRVKKFSLLLLAKIKSEKLEEILNTGTSPIGEMAPENVTTSGTLKLDARSGCQQVHF